MNGQPLAFWQGFVLGMLWPFVFVVACLVIGHTIGRVCDWYERRAQARAIAREFSRATEKVS